LENESLWGVNLLLLKGWPEAVLRQLNTII
jgi:hypothetical protein